MFHRLILKVTKFQLSPPKRFSTLIKNIFFWGGRGGDNSFYQRSSIQCFYHIQARGFGKIQVGGGGGEYMRSNCHQTRNASTLGQNLSKAIKILLTTLLLGKYDVIKYFSVLFQVEI